MTGALTYSFIEAVQNECGLTYGRLLHSIRSKIRETQKRQNGPNAPSTPQVCISMIVSYQILHLVYTSIFIFAGRLR